MSSSPLVHSVSPLTLSPRIANGDGAASDDAGSPLLRKLLGNGRAIYTHRRPRVGPRVYMVCIFLALLYLFARTVHSYDAIRQLAADGPSGILESGRNASRVFKVMIPKPVYGGRWSGGRYNKYNREPNCRRQYWHKGDNGNWIPGSMESYITDYGTPCSEGDEPLSSPPEKPQCPEMTSILLVLLTSSSTPSSQLAAYLAEMPCIHTTTSLAIYSTTPSHLAVPYPHTDCMSCNARVEVPIHDAIALAAANHTLPPDVARLHDAMLSHQAQGWSASPLEGHKAFKNLQKHRLLPALLHAYHTHPKQKWFVVAMPGVHVNIRSIAAWARQIKMAGPVYAGAELAFNGQLFAPLDAGIVLNREAVGRMAKLEEWDVKPDTAPQAPVPEATPTIDAKASKDRGVPAILQDKETYGRKWYNDLAGSPHADVALASALQDIGVNLTRTHPLMRATNLLDIVWDSKLWCKAALTWGKVDEAQHAMLGHAERKASSAVKKHHVFGPGGLRNASRHFSPGGAITHGDIFRYGLLPRLSASPSLLSWDNGAGDLEFYQEKGDFHHAAKSFNSATACMGACGLAMDCVQWLWEPGRCKLGTCDFLQTLQCVLVIVSSMLIAWTGRTVKMGRPAVDADDKVKQEWNGMRQGMVSGWMGSRIEEMAEMWDKRCWNSTAFEIS